MALYFKLAKSNEGKVVVNPKATVRCVQQCIQNASGVEEHLQLISFRGKQVVHDCTNPDTHLWEHVGVPEGSTVTLTNLGLLRDYACELRRGKISFAVDGYTAPEKFVEDTVRRIQHVEFRGVTVAQLRNIVDFLRNLASKSGFVADWLDRGNLSSTYGQPVKWMDLNLYQFVDWVVKPATRHHNCSFVEFLTKDPKLQRPEWFCSHFWGEALVDFMECVEEHSIARKLGKDDPRLRAYWVCAYANNQHNLGDSVTWDPQHSSFFKALQICRGMVLLLDGRGEALKRIWCVFEMFTAISRPNLTFDISIAMETPISMTWLLGGKKISHTGKSLLITPAGLLFEEQRVEAEYHGSGYRMRADREAHVPLGLIEKAMDIDVRTAEAQQCHDKRRILNSIAGVPLHHMDKEPPDSHQRYDLVNNRMRAVFAKAGWLGAVRNSRNAGVRTFLQSMSRDESNPFMEFAIPSLDNLNSDTLRELATSLHGGLRKFHIDLCLCRNFDGSGLVDIIQCLPDELEELHVILNFCSDLEEGPFQSWVQQLEKFRNMRSLLLWANGCRLIGAGAVQSLAGGLPHCLERLEVRMASCNLITNSSFQELCEHLPKTLRELHMDFQHSIRGGEDSARHLARQLEGGYLKNVCDLSYKPNDPASYSHRIIKLGIERQVRRCRARELWQQLVRYVRIMARERREDELSDMYEIVFWHGDIVRSIEQRHLDDMAGVVNPPRGVKDIARAVVLLLQPHNQLKTSWWRFRCLLKQVGSAGCIRSLIAGKMRRAVFERSAELLQDAIETFDWLRDGSQLLRSDENEGECCRAFKCTAWRLAKWLKSCHRIRQFTLKRPVRIESRVGIRRPLGAISLSRTALRSPAETERPSPGDSTAIEFRPPPPPRGGEPSLAMAFFAFQPNPDIDKLLLPIPPHPRSPWARDEMRPSGSDAYAMVPKSRKPTFCLGQATTGTMRSRTANPAMQLEQAPECGWLSASASLSEVSLSSAVHSPANKALHSRLASSVASAAHSRGLRTQVGSDVSGEQTPPVPQVLRSQGLSDDVGIFGQADRGTPKKRSVAACHGGKPRRVAPATQQLRRSSGHLQFCSDAAASPVANRIVPRTVASAAGRKRAERTTIYHIHEHHHYHVRTKPAVEVVPSDVPLGEEVESESEEILSSSPSMALISADMLALAI